jgi:hypothetical protein
MPVLAIQHDHGGSIIFPAEGDQSALAAELNETMGTADTANASTRDFVISFIRFTPKLQPHLPARLKKLKACYILVQGSAALVKLSPNRTEQMPFAGGNQVSASIYRAEPLRFARL